MTMLWVLGLAHAVPPDATVSLESEISADEAEIHRLREEMNKFQESGALQYSERVYKQMLDLDVKQQWMITKL